MDSMKCPECGSERIDHIIFCYLCRNCTKVIPLPPEDMTGRDFLIRRYTAPEPGNAPGEDIAFTPLNVNQKG